VFESRISFVPLFDLEQESGLTTATFGGGFQCLEDDYFWSSAHNILKRGAEFYGIRVTDLILSKFCSTVIKSRGLFFFTGQPSA